ncbi:MAG: MBL fold metallo-hydrolase [bacterium]|nr:MBL fold metallo-hydrolase [bacterium]
MINATLLGTGTSTGVPSVACDCATCQSIDPRDKRLRSSLLLRSASTTVVIDTSPDFRQQMLTHNVMDIDGVVYTHHHFDHIGGFDDIRPYNFRSKKPLPIYGMTRTIDVIRQTFPYAFGAVEQTGGGVPEVDINFIDEHPFSIGDLTLVPIPLLHGTLRVNGYRIGDIAYCTDTNSIPESSMGLLKGLDVLVLNGLRWKAHSTHFTIDEALRVVAELKPRITYLTHIAHQVKYAEGDAYLPEHVRLAWDGLTIHS